MSNNNRMIVFASILGAILATGLLALNPSTITNAGAQMYANDYGHNNNYYQDDNRYSYDNNHPKKSSHTNIQCINSNINVNGIDITKIPRDATALAATNEETTEGVNTQNGNGLGNAINFDRNLVNICLNVNLNAQVKISSPEEQTCEDCFSDLSETQINCSLAIVGTTSIEVFCDLLLDTPNSDQETPQVIQVIENIPDITQ
jgi:hypothetical protein